MESLAPIVSIPYSTLPLAQDWKNGKIYRVKVVLKQVSSSEDSSEFEILDASPLDGESGHKSHDYFTDTGRMKGQ